MWPHAFRTEPGAQVGPPAVAQELEELIEDSIILILRASVLPQPGPERLPELILPEAADPLPPGAFPQLYVLVEIDFRLQVQTLMDGCLEERDICGWGEPTTRRERRSRTFPLDGPSTSAGRGV